MSLEQEKQERILNAALSEFSQKGFKKASTNEIVKEAHIAKGLLFHYFNNKKDLFLFLYDYSLQIFMNDFVGKIDLSEKDVLTRLRQMACLKVELIGKHPQLFNFMLAANFEESEEVKPGLKLRNQEVMAGSMAMFLGDIDVSKFKEGIDIPRALHVMIWTLEGLRNQEQEKARSIHLDALYYEQVLKEMDIYLELFRKCFYR
ncbi:MAG TPA: TetR/AcrR family transcriptional regulator [Syntrophomonadaceae bacterium]|nr:TetR/AcrR family transcriptional regulator [Syntrophomonadaceae bacterium]